MANEIKDRLKKMDENWKQGKQAMASIPDGIYTMQLLSANLRISESSGKLSIMREHTVIEGEYTGEVVRDFMSLETPQGPRFVSQWIEQMGWQSPDDSSDLMDTIEAISNEHPCYTASVKTNGDFQNIRIKDVFEADETGEEGEAESSEESAEEPEAEDSGTWEIGDAVIYMDGDNTVIEGTVSGLGEEGMIEIQDANGDLWDVDSSCCSSPSEDEAESGDEGDLSELTMFAQAHGLDDLITEEDTSESAAAKLAEYEWEEASLLDTETDLLTRNGVEVTPKPAPAPKPKPKSTPASASAPAKGAKPKAKK